jgi:hypothetical protein
MFDAEKPALISPPMRLPAILPPPINPIVGIWVSHKVISDIKRILTYSLWLHGFE